MPRIDVGQLSQELDQVQTWLATQKSSFENVQKSVDKFQVDTLASFQGKTGDSVRAYTKEVYQPVHMEMMKVEAELRPVLDTITNDGKGRFGDNGIVDSDYIQEWSARFDKYTHQLVDLTHEVNRDLRSVADIIHLELLKTDELEEIHHNTKRHCQRTIEQIDEFDHETNAKIQPVQASILRLQNMVQEVSNKAPSMSGYQSGSFKFSTLSAMKQYSEEDKKKFVENMKTQYGFDDEACELLWKVHIGIEDKYSHTDEQYRAWLFNRVLGGLVYDDGSDINPLSDWNRWNNTAGAIGKYTTIRAEDFLKTLGFSEEESWRLGYYVKSQHNFVGEVKLPNKHSRDTDEVSDYYKKKNNAERFLGRILTETEFEEYFESVKISYKGKNDLSHQAITTATMLNRQWRPIADIATGGKTDDTSGWLGDLGGGGANRGISNLDASDYKTDLDSYNISIRIKNSGKSYVDCMNEYYRELTSGKTNRAKEFVGNQGGMDNIKKKIDAAQKNQQATQNFLWSLENEENELQVEPPRLP